MSDLSNPFPGLRCFLSEEDYLFFGRHEQIEDLLRRLRTNRLVAVVGTSGSGKSSLVRAGLLPAVLGGGMSQAGSAWEIAVMRPGGSPLAHLARALCEAGLYDADAEDALFHLQATLNRSRNGLLEAVRQSEGRGARGEGRGSKLLLVVDQFEELFRFHRASSTSQEEAIGFVNLLLHATQQADQSVYVVLTMRSDFLGECSQFLGLAEAVNDGEFLIPRMTRDQIQEAIEGPIRVRGAAIAPRLLFRLLNDVQDSQDQLPVLQHALMRTWDLWRARGEGRGARGESERGASVFLAPHPSSLASQLSPLDLEHYEATGGMQEALSQHADEIFEALPSEAHRTAAARIFKALTERGPDGRGIRRPTRLGELAAIAAVDGSIVHQVIEAYRVPGVTFLMPPVTSALDDSSVIDISHESLMRVWRRLRSWVEEEAQSARIYRRLHETAGLHAEKRAGLYHDPDLQIARSWREVSGPNVAWAEQYGGGYAESMTFLNTSRAAAERAEQEREAARQRELERARQLAEAQARGARLFKRFAAGLAVVLCLTVALAIWALMLRHDAKEQEQEAIRQRAEANKQREIAEDEEKKTKALELAELVLTVDTPNVAAHIANLGENRQLCDPMLREAYDEAPPKSSRKLHASLALLPVDPGQADYLYGRLLEADARELPVIRDALAAHKDRILDRLWTVVEKPEKGKESSRLRAAAALATYDPDSKRWGSNLQIEGVVFLSTLQEKKVRVLGKFFRKDGFIDCPRVLPVVVDGARCPHSLFTHPDAKTFASVSYDLDQPYTQLLARVSIPAVAPEQGNPTAPLTFEVIGDGKSIWKSNPLARRGDIQDCALSMLGVKQLELRVNNAGSSSWAHPVWLEPRLTVDQESQVAVAVVNDLVAVPAADLAAWKDALRPARLKLLAPLSALYPSINRSAEQRSLAMNVLADYAVDQPQVLAELLMDADEKQFAIIYPKLKDYGERILPVLTAEIEKSLPPEPTWPLADASGSQEPLADASGSQEARRVSEGEKLAKRQANAAVALLRMNRPERVWPLLRHSPDPRARSYLIHRLSPLGADAEAIAKQLDREPDPTIRRALLLSLGEFGEKVTPDERKALLPKVQGMYVAAADPGLRAASEWLLRQWKEDAWLKEATEKGRGMSVWQPLWPSLLFAVPTPIVPRWYVNGQGQTLVVVPGPVDFWMGSPPAEEGREKEAGTLHSAELRHWQRIGRSFAIASKKVTVEQFLRFRKDHPISRQHVPSDDCPVNSVSWYDAAEYCNWLSEQEGIPKEQWCYEPNAEVKYAPGMKKAANYLTRTGYRLPTEAEWEYACRAGAVTRFYFGESEELLPSYAWYQKNGQNKSWPVGSLKPNDLGLFDMLGNVLDWCPDAYEQYGKGEDGKATEDAEEIRDIDKNKLRVSRGGSFVHRPDSFVRSAGRGWDLPTNRQFYIGFRLARTLPFRSFDRYAAARAAALAAAGQSNEKPPLDDAAKAKLRRQALDWLRAELTDWLRAQPPRVFVARSLWHWQQDSALAGIRDQAALAKLAPEEQKVFTQFWAAVARLAGPANNNERLDFARVAVLIATGQGKDEMPFDEAAKAKLRGQAFDWLKGELTVGADRAVKARIIAAAAPLPALLEKLVESAPNDGQFHAELARHHAEQGNKPLANATGAKAIALLEKQLEQEPDNYALAGELADLMMIDPRWIVLKPAEMKAEGGAILTRLEDDSILVSGPSPAQDVYTLTFRDRPALVQQLRLEVLPHESLPKNGPGRHPSGEFILSTVKVQLDHPRYPGKWRTLRLARASADNRTGPDSDARFTIDVSDRTGWKTEVGKPHFAVFEHAEPVTETVGTALRVTLECKWGQQYLLGRFRVSVSRDPAQLTDPWVKLAVAYAEKGSKDEALKCFGRALQRADDRAGKARVIAVAASWPGLLDKLAESNSNDRLFQAELARHYADRGNNPLTRAARTKARTLFEKQLAKEPENSALATELADLLLIDTTSWMVLKPLVVKSEGGATLTVQPDSSVLASGNSPAEDVYTVEVEAERPVTALRLEALTHPSLPGNGPGRSSNGNFHLKDIRVRPVADPPRAAWNWLRAYADFSQSNDDAGSIQNAVDDNPASAWGIWPELGRPHWAVLVPDLRVGEMSRGRLTVRLDMGDQKWARTTLGCFRLSVSDDPAAFDHEQKRFAARKLTDPWVKLAAAYALNGRNDRAAEYFGKALQADPKLADDRQTQHRYHAARAAALAAAGQGKDEPLLDDAARAKLRAQTRDWLKAELTVWGNLLASGPPQDRPNIVQTLSHWQKDTDLAGIRDAAALAKLPPEEQKAFAQLWADVAALLKKAEAAPK